MTELRHVFRLSGGSMLIPLSDVSSNFARGMVFIAYVILAG